MATETSELLLRVTVDAQTGKLKIVDEDLKKLKASSGAAGTEVDKMAAKITAASIAFERKQRAVNNVRDGIIRAQSSFVGFGGTVGQVTGHVFSLTNQIEDLEFAAKRTGKNIDVFNSSASQSAGALGKLGTASLIVSAAMAGWKIGTWINETLGLGKAIDSLTRSMMGFNDQTFIYSKANKTQLEGFVASADKAGKTDFQLRALANANRILAGNVFGTHGPIKQQAQGLNEVVTVTAKADPVVRRLGGAFKEQKKEVEDLLVPLGKLPFALDALAPAWLKITQMSASGSVFHTMPGTIQHLVANLDLLAPAANNAADSMEDSAAAALAFGVASQGAASGTQKLSSVVGQLTNVFGMLGQQTGGGFGALLSSIGSGIGAFDSILKETGSTAKAIAGGIGTAMAGLAAATEGAVQKILNAGSMLLMGFATGGVWGLALAAIVIGISAIIDSIETGADRAGAAAARLGFQISEALSEQIHEFGKGMTSTANEILVSLDLIANEIGITEINVISFITGFTRALDEFAIGSEAMFEAMKDLNSLLPKMIEMSTGAFGILSDEMLAFIERIQAAGVEVKALTAFMTGQFSNAATSITALIDQWAASLEGLDLDNLGLKDLIETRGEFESFFTMIMAQMNEMIAQGFTLSQVFEMLGPAMNTLRDAAIDLGLKSDPAFKTFFNLFRIMKSGAAETLSSLSTLTTSFANLGILGVGTQKVFDSLQDVLGGVFDKFNKDGKISRAEMIAMLPNLAQMRAMAEQYGLALDADTQAMIDLAISRGLLPEDMPIDPVVDLANTIRDDLIPEFKAMTAELKKFIDALLGIPTDIYTTHHFTEEGAPPGGPAPKNWGGGGGGGWQTASGGGGARESQQQRTAGQTSTTTHNYNIQITGSKQDAKEIAKAVVNLIETRRVPFDSSTAKVNLIGKI